MRVSAGFFVTGFFRENPVHPPPRRPRQALLADVDVHRLGLLDLFRKGVAAVDPDLHPDPSVGGERLSLGEIDIGPERLSRNPTLAHPLPAGHLHPPPAAPPPHSHSTRSPPPRAPE